MNLNECIKIISFSPGVKILVLAEFKPSVQSLSFQEYQANTQTVQTDAQVIKI